jgi:hypothetical protein
MYASMPHFACLAQVTFAGCLPLEVYLVCREEGMFAVLPTPHPTNATDPVCRLKLVIANAALSTAITGYSLLEHKDELIGGVLSAVHNLGDILDGVDDVLRAPKYL